jgi:alcohol dehydrogenase class IV
MAVYQVKLPPCAYAGEGSIEKIKEIVAKEGAKSILVFTDKGIRATGLLNLVTDELDAIQANYKIFDDLKPEPAYTDVESLLAEVDKVDGDFVIAIGGGSVMDAAKLTTVLKNAPYTIRDLLNDPTIARKYIKSVMIPTTCGTGAEATCNAIVAIPEEQSKKGIVNDSMIPDYVILDSRTIRRLPKPIVAATGVDALAHVVECYTSKKATPLSDTYALAGAKLIFANIRRAYENPDDIEAKDKMLLGAYYGGVAITASGTTAVHALSYPLGGKYHIAHGVSNAILFAHVMEYNKEACEPQLAELCDAINPAYVDKSSAEKAQYVIDEIADIVKVTNIPTDLEQFGVKMEDLDFLVDAGSKQTRLLVNNRRELSLDDIRSIYLKVLK